jgi:Domain of unknown function (DUF4932)
MRRVILYSIGALSAQQVAAQPVRINVDPRVELMVIVFKLAGSSEFNQNRLQPYSTEIDRHFGPFRKHPAIARVTAVRDSQGLYFDRVTSLAVSVTEPPSLLERVPFDQPPGRCCTPATARLLTEIRRFAVDSRANDFFAAHRELYDSASARMRRMVERHANLGWFTPFFGTPAGDDFIIVPLLANSGTNFGPRVRPATGRAELYAILAHVTDSAGFPTYDSSLVATLVHEFNHPFVNPLVDARRADFESSASHAYTMVQDAMREQGYGSWPSMVYESVVDAAVARYYNARLGNAAMREFTASKHSGGWLWLTELAVLLGEYESRRSMYPTLRTFMPRVVAYFDSLPRRLPQMQREYDATRPKIVAMSIQNGSQTIDPALGSIEIRFDRPMRSASHGVFPVRGGRERLPRVTRQAFDSTGRVFTMSVALDPERDYEFTLNRHSGGGFVSVDGVPLARVHVRFRTLPRKAGY